MTPHVVVYGPRGCGKTYNAQALADAFGCERIVDYESTTGGGPEVLNVLDKSPTLILTSRADLEVPGTRRVSFAEAMRSIGNGNP